MEKSNSRLSKIARLYDRQEFLSLHDERNYSDYIDLIYERPRIVRTSFQRIYDMIVEPGTHTFERYRKTYTHYNFFDNEEITIYGLAETKDRLVKFIKGAAGHYGTEKRILLLTGPVGSAKSTIARLLKRGLEAYSRTLNGVWYSFKWIDLPTGPDGIYTSETDPCPMNEEPLKLMPLTLRRKVLADLNEVLRERSSEEERKHLYDLRCDGELCPRCKKFMEELMVRNGGDWEKVMEKHIRVVRKVYSEADRIGIGTFQPKDEKNQDATELSGDVNWGKLPHYGSDSDPRAFNYDGELNIGNRGMVEFIEMLKLDQAFLYDLLGASQEKQIKPKKFAQISIDEMLMGHSVHGSTPIPHEYDGVLDVLPIEDMADLDPTRLRVFSVNVETKEVELSGVKQVFSHKFEGEWVENHQDGDVLVTTPNHSVYNQDYETFYPGSDRDTEILTVDIPIWLVSDKPCTSRWREYFAIVQEELVPC